MLDGVPAFLRGANACSTIATIWRSHARSSDAQSAPVRVLDLRRGARGSPDGAKLDETRGVAAACAICSCPPTRGASSRCESDARAAAQRARLAGGAQDGGARHRSQDRTSDGVRLDIGETPLYARPTRISRSGIGTRVLVAPMIGAVGRGDAARHDPAMSSSGRSWCSASAASTSKRWPTWCTRCRPSMPPKRAGWSDRLKLRALLHSRRHKQPLALDEFCALAARFSSLVAALGDLLVRDGSEPGHRARRTVAPSSTR